MQLHFYTVDVFTSKKFGGNQLAVVMDADGLSTVQMQRIANEFNYSESAFVRRAKQRGHDAEVRIFTPTVEVPFAGHPNVGTAYVMTTLDERWVDRSSLIFEEKAGLVRVDITRAGDAVTNLQLTAPEALSTGSRLPASAIADCLGLDVVDIRVDVHPPIVASVGLPFVIVELNSREALKKALPNVDQFAKWLPCEGADAIYLYSRRLAGCDGEVDFSARMFAPADGLAEDPATGSATGATCALLCSLSGDSQKHCEFHVAQGIDMGRESELHVVVRFDGGVSCTKVGGICVPVMTGTITL